jgi:ribosomal-protein-alanine N-acetyltransferase
MRLSDISSVMDIERSSFPAPWREDAYRYEIAENRLANYQVLTVELADLPSQVIGYAGFWMLVDEAHISTIAVATKWRRRGLGHLLLLNVLYLAYKSNAVLATLEVRSSNTVAQELYRDYRFEVVGGRKRYYQGKEDALIMTVEPLDSTYRSFLNRKWKALLQQLSLDLVREDSH